jgi:hypothetical protein
MLLEVFDTQLGVQCMEGICELWHYLAPLLTQCAPSHVLVIIVYNRVIIFLNDIHKKFPSGFGLRHSRLLCGILLTVFFPPNFDMGENLKEHKGDILSIRKIVYV